MTRSTKTAVSLAGIVIGAMVASLITYYVGENFGQSIVAGAANKLKLDDWIYAYKGLINIMTFIIMIIALAYYVTLRFMSKISYPNDGAKRMFWAVFLVIILVFSLVFPYVYAVIEDDFINGLNISVLFVLVYGILYFWLGSILITPDAYKYAPIGATAVRK